MLVGEKETKPATGLLAPLKNRWGRLDPKRQKLVIFLGMAAMIAAVGTLGYQSRASKKPVEKTSSQKKIIKEIALDSHLIEKSMYTQAQQTMDEQQRALAAMQKEIERLKAEAVAPNPGPSQSSSKPSKKDQNPALPKPVQPRHPPAVNRSYPVPPPPASFHQDKASSEMLGGIVQVTSTTPVVSENQEDKKKLEIYLPPSFMEATLLSGLDASTTTAGKNEPVPVLLRINNLAVLPNLVKADLKGCFAMGEGRGNLASERVDVRLLTLSCVSKNGESVIDQAVKGYVVDGDGKAGLRGMVSAKMGSMLARSALAGFLGGAGEALQTSSLNYQQTPLGTQEIWSSSDTNTLIRGGIGGGISEPADQLQKFYLELAQQTLPIIQVGATKTVTLVISDGVNLEVKRASIIP